MFRFTIRDLLWLILGVSAFFAGYRLATKQADTALEAERETQKKLVREHLELVRELIKAETTMD